MAGKLYLNDFQLSRAYAEGSKGVPATNPHPAGSPANLAYTEGAKKACATYAGVAECSAGTIMPLVNPPSPAPPPAFPSGVPTEDWVKADIVDWLIAHGATEPRTTLQSMLKADLLALAP